MNNRKIVASVFTCATVASYYVRSNSIFSLFRQVTIVKFDELRKTKFSKCKSRG